MDIKEFALKDSGERLDFDSGMVRDTEKDKLDYTLVLSGPMFERWVVHLNKGAKKYTPNNWMKAAGEVEYERFRRSAFRHFIQWFRGDRDEDHAAAVIFNINGAEYVQDKMAQESTRVLDAITRIESPYPSTKIEPSHVHLGPGRFDRNCRICRAERGLGLADQHDYSPSRHSVDCEICGGIHPDG